MIGASNHVVKSDFQSSNYFYYFWLNNIRFIFKHLNFVMVLNLIQINLIKSNIYESSFSDRT